MDTHQRDPHQQHQQYRQHHHAATKVRFSERRPTTSKIKIAQKITDASTYYVRWLDKLDEVHTVRDPSGLHGGRPRRHSAPLIARPPRAGSAPDDPRTAPGSCSAATAPPHQTHRAGGMDGMGFKNGFLRTTKTTPRRGRKQKAFNFLPPIPENNTPKPPPWADKHDTHLPVRLLEAVGAVDRHPASYLSCGEALLFGPYAVNKKKQKKTGREGINNSPRQAQGLANSCAQRGRNNQQREARREEVFVHQALHSASRVSRQTDRQTGERQRATEGRRVESETEFCINLYCCSRPSCPTRKGERL